VKNSREEDLVNWRKLEIFKNMFDPAAAKADKEAKAKKKKIIAEIVNWSNTIVPVELQDGLLIDVKEVQCGDPSCAPIDTVFTMSTSFPYSAISQY
jgi:hypothetical protein